MTTAQTDYTRKAARYIEGVLSGRIPACRFVRQACERQRRDLEKAKTGKWRYIFSRQAANRICRFIECLTHVKGEKAGETIHLEPWQAFILTVIFGWLDRKTGKRRFRKCYIEVPRGNGKSTMLSGVGLYLLTADGEKGADIYSFATTRDQARIVFADALAMARGNRDFREAYGVTPLAHSIVVIGTNSKFLAKSSDADTLDGLNTHGGIIDELHAHKTRYVFDVVESSITKRAQPMVISITTAGFILDGICMEQRRTIAHILDQSITDDSYFGIIYTIDAGDDWQTEDALKKANPNWGVSVKPDTALSAQKSAKINTSAQKNFLTKYLDIWVNSDSAWMDMERYRKCISPELKRGDFRGKYCIFAVDLASKLDISAIIRTFWRRDPESGEMHYYFFADYYLPEAAVNNSDNPAYDGWRRAGFLQATGGDVTDLNALEETLLAGLKEKMLKGVTLKANDHFDGGFRIAVQDGKAYYDYSAEAVVDMPVLRPLIGMDKSEIIAISQKIGTFETSIQPYEDCCTVFTPKHPKTRPVLSEILIEEQKLDVDGLVQSTMENIEIIRIGE